MAVSSASHNESQWGTQLPHAPIPLRPLSGGQTNGAGRTCPHPSEELGTSREEALQHPAPSYRGEPAVWEHQALPRTPTNGEGSPCRITTAVSPMVLPAWRGCFLPEVFAPAALPTTG